MKNFKTIVATCLLFIAFSVAAQNSKDKKIMADADKAKATLIEKDPGIIKFFDNASGYAIFPNVGKGGLIIGGASGNGVVYENGSAVGMTSLKKVNIGLQAGGQAVIEVIFFETDAALAEFKEGNYEFSAQVSAVVADKGKSKNVDYSDGVLVFTLPKAGFMADVSVGGQKFEYDAFE